MKEECWDKGGGRAGQHSDVAMVKCWKCKQYGHFRSYCAIERAQELQTGGKEAVSSVRITAIDKDKEENEFFVGTCGMIDGCLMKGVAEILRIENFNEEVEKERNFFADKDKEEEEQDFFC